MRAILLLIIATFLAFQSSSEDPGKARFARLTPLALSPEEECRALNSSCDQCVKGTSGVSCYQCGTDCRVLAFSGITSGDCNLNDIKVGQCQLNGLAIVVLICGAVLAVLGVGCVVVCLGCYCYCHFCKGRRRRTTKTTKSLLRMENEMSEIGERHAQRKAERQAKNDELRRKYGMLSEDDKSGYERI